MVSPPLPLYRQLNGVKVRLLGPDAELIACPDADSLRAAAEEKASAGGGWFGLGIGGGGDKKKAAPSSKDAGDRRSVRRSVLHTLADPSARNLKSLSPSRKSLSAALAPGRSNRHTSDREIEEASQSERSGSGRDHHRGNGREPTTPEAAPRYRLTASVVGARGLREGSSRVYARLTCNGHRHKTVAVRRSGNGRAASFAAAVVYAFSDLHVSSDEREGAVLTVQLFEERGGAASLPSLRGHGDTLLGEARVALHRLHKGGHGAKGGAKQADWHELRRKDGGRGGGGELCVELQLLPVKVTCPSDSLSLSLLCPLLSSSCLPSLLSSHLRHLASHLSWIRAPAGRRSRRAARRGLERSTTTMTTTTWSSGRCSSASRSRGRGRATSGTTAAAATARATLCRRRRSSSSSPRCALRFSCPSG